MRNLFYIGLLMAGLISPTFAGDKVGNGGDVVVCRNTVNEVTSIEALDIYEGRVRWTIELDLGDASLSPLQKVELALSRLGRISSIRAERYLEKAKQFDANALFLDNTELPDISDSNHLIFPKGCKVEQIIVQRTPHFSDDRRYLVSNDLWKQLDSTNKAALILHEIIYEEALEFGHQDSVPTRYFNAHLMSHRFETFTPKEMAAFFKTIDFKKFDYQGFIYASSRLECHHQFSKEEMWPIQFFDNGMVVKSGCILSGSIEVQGQKANVAGFISFHDNGQPHSFMASSPDPQKPLMVRINEKDYAPYDGGEIQLYQDSSLKAVVLALDDKNGLVFESTNYSLNTVAVDNPWGKGSRPLTVILYPNGGISSLIAIEPDRHYPKQIKGWGMSRGQRIYIRSNRVDFFSDETVKMATISYETPLTFTIDEHQLKFAGYVELYETGELKSGIFIAEPQKSFWGNTYFEKIAIPFLVGDQKTKFWLKKETNDWFEGRYIHFYPGYKVKQGMLAQSATFKTTDGQTIVVQEGQIVSLDEQGRLLQGQSEY